MVLRKYAVECGFRFKYVKNDSIRITAICMIRELKGCMWSVYARILHGNGFFYLHKWNSNHSCGVNVRTPKNPRAGFDLMSDVISERMRDKPPTQPTDVAYYRVAWLEVEKARGEMFSAYSISFDQLRWYNNVVMENNPRSYSNIDYDKQNYCFISYFISFKACIDGFNHCRPLLFLDGMFLKGKFKGNLLATTAKDDNQGLFHLAIAIVDSENTMNWSWLLGHLANVVNGQRPLTFVTDLYAGLVELIPSICPTADHTFRLQHLQHNLQYKLRYLKNSYQSRLLVKFRACAYAPIIVAFNQSLEDFMKIGRKVAPAFLNDLPPAYCANAYFRGACYGEMSFNAIESFNLWIREARHLQITQMIDSIRTKIMRQMAKHQCKAQSWAGVVCPKMEDRLVKAYNKGRSWLVSQSNNDIYEVHSFPSVMVDMRRRTCSCFQWQIKGFPCAHTIVTIHNNGLDLYELVALYYHMAEYRNSYAHNINPISTVKESPFSVEDFVIQPPVVIRPLGRPKKKRMLFRGKQVQTIRCSHCQRLGNHNRKTYKKPI